MPLSIPKLLKKAFGLGLACCFGPVVQAKWCSLHLADGYLGLFFSSLLFIQGIDK
jgi:hypothetical protein